jgi:glycerophosphoryl diester phosphodiesterase
MNRTPLTPAPLVYAHRGDRSRAPDNTLEAYRLAVEAGTDGIELDVRRTRDGVLIMSHDAQFPDMPPYVEMTMADVRTHIPQVPTLVEMLHAVPQHIWLNVEIKNDPQDPYHDPTRRIVDQTIETIAEHDSLERILLSSFDVEAMRRAAGLRPGLLRGQLIRQPKTLEVGITEALEQDAHAVHPNILYFVEDAVGAMQQIRDAGLAAVVWWVNTPEQVHMMLEVGVDVIITDDPGMARRILDQG